MKALVYEVVAVARKEGIALDGQEVYEYIINLAQQAYYHLTSPLIDVLNRRKTEVDSLNGAIVEKAQKYGIEVPYHTTIYYLIRIIENTYNQAIYHLES